ncbi:hypothetical protein ACFU6S_41185 [Streptomyces sp. NPDC057456]
MNHVNPDPDPDPERHRTGTGGRAASPQGETPPAEAYAIVLML